MKKRPFLLLEILLAILLVSLCLGPLVNTPFLLGKKGRSALLDLEMERIADSLYYEVRERVQTLSWEELTVKRSEKIPLSPVTIDLGELGTYTYATSYRTYRGKGIKGHEIRLLRIKIALQGSETNSKPSFYKYDLLVRKEKGVNT